MSETRTAAALQRYEELPLPTTSDERRVSLELAGWIPNLTR